MPGSMFSWEIEEMLVDEYEALIKRSQFSMSLTLSSPARFTCKRNGVSRALGDV